MKHLYTLTGNLLAETTAVYESTEWDQTHRAAEESFQVGGKGINVAKMAQRLGTFSTAVCFPGGHTGARCLAWLKARDFDVAPFSQIAETRAGWVVRSGDSETTFMGRDRAIEEEPWLEAMEFLEQKVRPGDIFAVCGSLPGWSDALGEPLRKLLGHFDDSVFTAVDTYGPPLSDLLDCRLDLVKINRMEFAGLWAAGAGDADLESNLAEVARRYPKVKRWVITAGGGPVVGLDEEGTVRIEPPPIEVVSAVGSGDVLLAALLHGLVGQKLSLADALREAVPLAAANAAGPGIADFEFGPLRRN